VIDTEESNAVKSIRDVEEYRDASTQQVAEALKSEAINCFFSQQELIEYGIFCRSKHGCAAFKEEKASMERAGVPKTNKALFGCCRIYFNLCVLVWVGVEFS